METHYGDFAAVYVTKLRNAENGSKKNVNSDAIVCVLSNIFKALAEYCNIKPRA